MPDEYDEPPPEIETSLECPVCGKNLFLIYYTTEIPFEGTVVINTYVCHSCLYKNPQVTSETAGKKEKITFRIESKEDLNVVIYRSPSGSISIPELEAQIFPGDDAKGEITTVEGVLRTIYERLDVIADTDSDLKKLETLKERLSNEESALGLSLVIEDETGRSRINSKKAKCEFP